MVVSGDGFFLWETASFCNCPSVSVSQCLSVLVSIVEDEGELPSRSTLHRIQRCLESSDGLSQDNVIAAFDDAIQSGLDGEVAVTHLAGVDGANLAPLLEWR